MNHCACCVEPCVNNKSISKLDAYHNFKSHLTDYELSCYENELHKIDKQYDDLNRKYNHIASTRFSENKAIKSKDAAIIVMQKEYFRSIQG